MHDYVGYKPNKESFGQLESITKNIHGRNEVQSQGKQGGVLSYGRGVLQYIVKDLWVAYKTAKEVEGPRKNCQVDTHEKQDKNSIPISLPKSFEGAVSSISTK
eukprot:TRINITY_DN3433_c0_g1_i1.p6 TRINITY_DN3433_c0_g1~~TRINITY_DN3433_c0_g1_i1.p6  ORF type:complete len:103 (-),score=4.51 TRINITY_DN3433_c0_g1_i1:267-575(-)